MSDNSLVDSVKGMMFPIHKEGYPFIAAFAAIAFILSLMSTNLGWIGIILTVWCVCFFRDPVRMVPQASNLVICPADGIVQSITQCPPPRELKLDDKPVTRISVFMNVFNCHVNRAPVSGTISAMHYYPGKFLNASLDKASEENERQALAITTPSGDEFAVVQIAGLVARRIITSVQPAQNLEAGERFGIIRFGSRVDIYLPDGFAPNVAIGQTTIAGETVIAAKGSIAPSVEFKNI